MLKWQSDHPPLPDAILSAAELILGLKLPEAYRTTVQRWPGGHPDPSSLAVAQQLQGAWISCVGVLMSLDPRHVDNVFQCISSLAVDDQLPRGLVPIIDDGGGDLLCLDYRSNAAEPAVVYWAHEQGGDEGLVDVAPSFAAFLGLLEGEATDRSAGSEVSNGGHRQQNVRGHS